MTYKEAREYLIPVAANCVLPQYAEALEKAMEALELAESVVQCEDCKWIDEDGDCAHEEMLDQSGYPKSVKKDFFCGHGEKRAFDGDYVKYGKRRRADNG
jgi:hypothetical protein